MPHPQLPIPGFSPIPQGRGGGTGGGFEDGEEVYLVRRAAAGSC